MSRGVRKQGMPDDRRPDVLSQSVWFIGLICLIGPISPIGKNQTNTP